MGMGACADGAACGDVRWLRWVMSLDCPTYGCACLDVGGLIFLGW